MTGPIRVLFSCSGVGIFNRGIESFFREAYDGLKGMSGIETRLLKGAGVRKDDEWVVANLPRTGRLASMFGRLARRNAYVIEQWSSFPGVVRRIRQFRPQVVFYSDSNLGFLLYWFRRQIGVPYRLLFSNGGPCHPPFVRTDFVQQVAPFYNQEAMDHGEPMGKHFLVPYGINVCSPPIVDEANKRKLRASLNLPPDRPVVLSVGWIASQHKRMDYLIEEIARLPEPRPYLQLLGAMDENSAEVIALGNRLLGQDNFGTASVPYERVAEYYRAADVFVLASLREGFGRVYLEAMMHGLPVIGHRHPVIEYVIGDQGLIADLDKPSGLTNALQVALNAPADERIKWLRWQSVRDRFSWETLAPSYAEMFRKAATSPFPG